MGQTLVIRYRTTPEAAEENQRLVEQVYAELAAEQPDGLRYMTLRLADGVSFVHVAWKEGADVLPNMPAFQEFQRGLGERLTEGPDASPAEVVGAYRVVQS